MSAGSSLRFKPQLPSHLLQELSYLPHPTGQMSAAARVEASPASPEVLSAAQHTKGSSKLGLLYLVTRGQPTNYDMVCSPSPRPCRPVPHAEQSELSTGKGCPERLSLLWGKVRESCSARKLSQAHTCGFVFLHSSQSLPTRHHITSFTPP